VSNFFASPVLMATAHHKLNEYPDKRALSVEFTAKERKIEKAMPLARGGGIMSSATLSYRGGRWLKCCRGARRNFQRNSTLVTDAFLLGVRDYSSSGNVQPLSKNDINN
jgi:hypothetical protein